MEIEKLTGWQPIETAPKDGTWFIAFGGGLDRPTPMKWCDRVGAWECDAVMLEDWDDQSEGYSRPKLWFAIPAPPGTTRAPADLRSALEAETIAALALVTAERAEHGLGACEWRDLRPDDQQTYLKRARAVVAALAPTKGDVS